ncbi:hypothetical protein RF11_11530 [Thelohanellus kitauei]|uniref:Tc1-like transposase DDE domain-containing protein n=1 Tax=Thelohanellus kitauei TaxID=669202 RepID=A0A0C2J0S7_THEKT|nr:hypothetical protein RF11_11530 [Thelohanellus kitauei]
MQRILGMPRTKLNGIIKMYTKDIPLLKHNTGKIGDRNYPKNKKLSDLYELIEEVDQENIYFLDETCFDVPMRHKRGRSKKDEVLFGTVDSIRPRNISVSTIINKNHTFHEENFCGYFMEVFKQLLSSGIHECIFTIDYLRFHKINSAQTMLHDNGRRVICLPPNLPFLNPIENLLSKWKNIVKTVSPGSETDVLNLIESDSIKITPSHCDGYCRNMLKYNRCYLGEKTANRCNRDFIIINDGKDMDVAIKTKVIFRSANLIRIFNVMGAVRENKYPSSGAFIFRLVHSIQSSMSYKLDEAAQKIKGTSYNSRNHVTVNAL